MMLTDEGKAGGVSFVAHDRNAASEKLMTLLIIDYEHVFRFTVHADGMRMHIELNREEARRLGEVLGRTVP